MSSQFIPPDWKYTTVVPIVFHDAVQRGYNRRVLKLTTWGRHGFDVAYKALGACRGYWQVKNCYHNILVNLNTIQSLHFPKTQRRDLWTFFNSRQKAIDWTTSRHPKTEFRKPADTSPHQRNPGHDPSQTQLRPRTDPLCSRPALSGKIWGGPWPSPCRWPSVSQGVTLGKVLKLAIGRVVYVLCMAGMTDHCNIWNHSLAGIWPTDSMDWTARLGVLGS